MAIWVATPAVTLTVADVTLSSPADPKRSVRGPTVPAMDTLVNTAWPAVSVVADVAPPSVPPPEAIRTPTAIPACFTGLPDPSCSWITGCCWKAIPLCTVPDGCVAIARRVAEPAVPVALKVTGLPASDPEAAVNVFGPAVGPRVHAVAAATPSAPVVTGLVGLTLPPPVPGANVTATPATELPNWSRTITDGGTATAVPTRADCPSPALIAIWVAPLAVPLARNVTGLPCSVPDVAVSVFGPAVVPSVQLVTAATPLALVVWAAPVMPPPPVPGAKVTATPATGLLKASRTITAGGTATAVPTVAAWPSPTLIAMDAAAAAVTPTLAVAVTCVMPFSVALIVFISALVELNVPVTWPLAPVGPVGCVRALLVPLAARVTVTPLTGFPNSSLAVTVIVAALVPPDAEIVPGSAATSDRAALGAPAVPVAVSVIGLPFTPGAVAVSVSWPATVPSVQPPTAAMPLALVVWLAPVMLPLAGATANVTDTPCTGLPFASFTITAGGTATAVFTVAVCLSPSLTAMLPALPAVPVARNVTGLPVSPDAAAVSLFPPAVVLRVQLPTVAMPPASVVWLVPVMLPLPGATAKVTATPGTGLPLASFTITEG